MLITEKVRLAMNYLTNSRNFFKMVADVLSVQRMGHVANSFQKKNSSV